LKERGHGTTVKRTPGYLRGAQIKEAITAAIGKSPAD
jgi:hypothetical protein